ncbi:hypothetical protein NCAS_0B04300 [Naumovozyma castellii]|uniref:Tyrosine-protein phosphatase domain-containing protein n=1 Tax=Naumovozyma castellii TaxID=27288 RepID=G0VAI9_NAUCA|nr:hypothetical protein NCAS_0B04300 [Naumovozyma castellii CBS 4309]CCC68514.1 hypothetical protein NCAS_0B04300 [Naumovozyma castellii CBS 4309]
MNQHNTVVAPLLFSTVQPRLYRGSYPREINIPFLKTLNLQYIVSLTPEPLSTDPIMARFCEESGIEMVHVLCQDEKKVKKKEKNSVKVKRKKKPVPIEYTVVEQCVKFLIDKKHYPCYIHCSNGELITSLVVACLRKFSYWSTVSILNEFLVYNSSINIHERNFIEHFNSEIEIDNMKLIDKVPWISAQYTYENKKNSGTEAKDDASSSRINSGIPNGLPKLKFHSL